MKLGPFTSSTSHPSWRACGSVLSMQQLSGRCEDLSQKKEKKKTAATNENARGDRNILYCIVYPVQLYEYYNRESFPARSFCFVLDY